MCVFQEYDYVFSVDIEDGKLPLKLPYNCDEDPWFAAQKFIHDNNLSQLYLDQVANFIVNNSKNNAPLGPKDSSPEFCDPLTGQYDTVFVVDGMPVVRFKNTIGQCCIA
jgi:phospholipase A-2-activating protein